MMIMMVAVRFMTLSGTVVVMEVVVMEVVVMEVVVRLTPSLP